MRPIAVITCFLRPEVSGIGPYASDFAAWWAARHGPVGVFACRAHYPDAALFDGPRSAANGGLPRHVSGAVTVVRRGPLFRRRDRVLRRLASELTWALAGALAVRRDPALRVREAVAMAPTCLAVPLARLAVGRGTVVAVVHDVQSGLARMLGVRTDGPFGRVLRAFERMCLQRADRIVVLSDRMGAVLRGMGVTRPIETIPLWTDLDGVRPIPRAATAPPIAAYSGTLGRKQGLEVLIPVADRLAVLMPEAKIVVRGDGPMRPVLEEAARSRPNLDVAGFVPQAALSESLGAASLHIVVQRPEGADFALPSKLLSIMAAGRPAIATARPDSPIGLLAAESGAIRLVPPSDAEALAQATAAMLADPAEAARLGTAGRAHVEREAALDRIAGRWTALLDAARAQK